MGVSGERQINNKREDISQSEMKNQIKDKGMINNNPNRELPDSILTAVKSICKVITERQIASGFLIKLFKGEKDFYCLMSNRHIIKKI